MKAREFTDACALGDERVFGCRQILVTERNAAGQDFMVIDR